MFIAFLNSHLLSSMHRGAAIGRPSVGGAIVSVQRREGRAMTSTPSPSTRSVPGTLASLYAKLGDLMNSWQRYTLPLLRITLGVVYIWFGALKVGDATPVGELVAKTLPFLPEHIFVPVLGVIEVLIGLALIAGKFLDLVALVMVGHLLGTFLVLVTQPSVSFQNNNALELTMTGEFVMKNVVLISAGLVLATRARVRAPRRDAVAVVETPLVAEPSAAQMAEGV
jgi:uncharacterized membrane protein YphA (DoxX/SURF4 family)